jgi:vancomycin permeability regulator SanA
VLAGAALLVLVILGVLLATAVAVWRTAHKDEARRQSRVQVIAVLGAAEYNGRPSATFQGRLQHAAALFERGFADRILVLGGNKPGDRTTEAAAGRQWLLDRGVPEADVFALPEGSNTLDSLRAAAAFMTQHGYRSVLLVSDPWHNLRIRRMARDLGLSAYVSATWHSAAKSHETRLSGYTRETFAYLYYRLLGR